VGKGSCLGQAELFALLKSLQWMPPAESWEPAVVAVRRDPLAARFDSQSCQISIGDEVAFDACRPAKLCEDLPMPSARSYEDAIGLTAHFRSKAKRVFQSARRLENPRMGHNPEEPGQDQVRHSVSLVRTDALLQPTAVGNVL